jgi:hypothetical protein
LKTGPPLCGADARDGAQPVVITLPNTRFIMADSSNGSSNGSGQKQFQVIGTRPIRHDGVDKVTGRAKYGADYSFPGML